jgi:hypothetical protein
MFRDESVRVHQKYRVASQKYEKAVWNDGEGSSHSEYESSPDPGAPGNELLPVAEDAQDSCHPIWALERPTERPTPTLGQSLSDVAMAFFLTEYTDGSHFDYMPLLYSHSPQKSLLANTIQAVSIVSLSHETRRPELMALARQKYSQGLIETNQALRDPLACREDTTVAAVLLLGHFETLASEDTTGFSDVAASNNTNHSPVISWDRHLAGVVSLLAYRPKPKLEDPVTFRLYQHVSAMVRYSSVQHRMRVPAEVSAWDFPFGTKREPRDPNRSFMVAIDAFTDLRACVKEGSLTDPLEIIQLAKVIDKQLARTARNFPSSWSYDIVATGRDSTTGVYKNKYHVYPNHHTAQLWNDLRMTRLAIQEMILINSEQARQLDDINYDEILYPVRARAVRVLDQMATEICQSTTQFLCPPSRASSPSQTNRPNSPSPRWSRRSSHLSSATPPSPSPTKPAASAYFLIWPLFLAAGASRIAPKSLAEFAIDRLRYIERGMKIPQAGRAASMLEAGNTQEDWLHMLHLF